MEKSILDLLSVLLPSFLVAVYILKAELRSNQDSWVSKKLRGIRGKLESWAMFIFISKQPSTEYYRAEAANLLFTGYEMNASGGMLPQEIFKFHKDVLGPFLALFFENKFPDGSYRNFLQSIIDYEKDITGLMAEIRKKSEYAYSQMEKAAAEMDGR